MLRAAPSLGGATSITSRPTNRKRIPMKTMILAAIAALSLGVGAAHAQGVPAGYQGAPHYGAQGSANG
jgi:hypothetical protein